jgi:hypothetical protein
MSYLTYEEYERIIGEEIEEKEFAQLLRKASVVLDVHTNRFYQRNDLENDVRMRKEAFKVAIAYQIEYMLEAGATTTFGIRTPKSWSVGRMNVSTDSSLSDSADLLSADALKVLSGTGLLYRGVR